jgi:hypothetical protein
MNEPVRFGHNEDGTLDGVFGDATFVHIEQIDDAQWWVGIDLAGGGRADVYFWTPRTRIRAHWELEHGMEHRVGGEFIEGCEHTGGDEG